MGMAFRNPLIGMMGVVILWFASFLFSGLFLKPEFIIWPFRVFCYLLPLRWMLRAASYLEYNGTEWDGAVLQSGGLGFTCPDAANAMQCFGRTGDQVLVSLRRQFGHISTEDTVLNDFLCILAIGVFFKLLYVTILV